MVFYQLLYVTLLKIQKTVIYHLLYVTLLKIQNLVFYQFLYVIKFIHLNMIKKTILRYFPVYFIDRRVISRLPSFDSNRVLAISGTCSWYV